MNTRLLIYAGLLLAAIALLNTACKKPSPFGSELLENEYADYAFTDTITVECTLLREDSVVTSDNAGAAVHFLCGEINDPILGKHRSDIYTLMQALTLNPSFSSTTLDSIVLYLNYAPAGVYGDTLQAQTLQVFRLDGNLRQDGAYYSTSTVNSGMEIGRVENFLPKPSSTDSLFAGIKGSFLRVRLDDSFGTELLQLDSLNWLTDSAFYEQLRGLKIVTSSSGANPGAMLAFDLNDNSTSRVALYYKQNADSTQRRFDFFFRNANKFTHFDHDFSGTEVAPHIGNVVDDKLYLLGMEGLKIKVSFPYANQLDQVAVNKAQLVLTVADDNPSLVPANQLVFTRSIGDTTFNFTSDVLYALGSAGNGSLATFGGFPEKEIINGNTSVTRYRLSLSEYFQHIINDDVTPDIKNRTVFLSVYPRNRSARRVILHGPKSNTFPAKLELKYTRVQ